MSVKVGVQQGFVGKHCVAHDTLKDQPAKEESRGKETESNAINASVKPHTLCAVHTLAVLQGAPDAGQ